MVKFTAVNFTTVNPNHGMFPSVWKLYHGKTYHGKNDRGECYHGTFTPRFHYPCPRKKCLFLNHHVWFESVHFIVVILSLLREIRPKNQLSAAKMLVFEASCVTWNCSFHRGDLLITAQNTTKKHFFQQQKCLFLIASCVVWKCSFHRGDPLITAQYTTKKHFFSSKNASFWIIMRSLKAFI